MSVLPSEPPGSIPPRLGDYEPLVLIASGGMASLFVARHVGAGGVERLVALKRVHPHLLLQEEFRNMFLDEARLASLIQHPNVVHLLAVEEVEGELLLVLEYVEGVSFARLLSAARDHNEQLPLSILSRVVCDMLAGLHAAHEAVDVRGRPLGLVHRDVSPQNLIVGADGVSRLIDFGIARAAVRVTDTTDGVIKGKPGYLSPEALLGKPLDRRADIFAAGVMLHEALTGARLFHGEDDGVFRRVFESVPPIAVAALELPEEVDSIVSKAVKRERSQRYQTAAEFLEALEKAAPPAASREVARCVQDYFLPEIEAKRRSVQEALAAATTIRRHRSPSLRPERAEPVDRDGLTLAAPSQHKKRRFLALLIAVAAASAALVALLFGGRPQQPTQPLGQLASTPAQTQSTTLSAAPPLSSPTSPESSAPTSLASNAPATSVPPHHTAGRERVPGGKTSASSAQPPAASESSPLHASPYPVH